MDRAADLRAEYVVDKPVLCEPREARERGRYDRGPEMVATAGEVLDLSAGAGDRFFYALLELGGRGHVKLKRSDVDSAWRVATLWKATMITLTDKGAEKVREFVAAQGEEVAAAGLRVGVRGGGCSGFQYQLAFDEQRDGDTIFDARGIKLLVDAASLPYVKGAEVDYVESLQGAGFQVNNPNVVAACGCGSSFRVAEEEEVSAV